MQTRERRTFDECVSVADGLVNFGKEEIGFPSRIA